MRRTFGYFKSIIYRSGCFLLVKKCPIYYRKSTHIENCYIKIIIKKVPTLLLKSSPFLSCTKWGDKIPNA